VQTEPSQREIGRRFRKAVEHELSRSGLVASDPSVDWLRYNGTRVALRYSSCEARRIRSKWFYGLLKQDSEELSAGGALVLIMPHPDGHRFALFNEEQTRDLLSHCRGSERGDLKIHLRYDDPLETYSVREWRAMDVAACVFALGAAAMDMAGITEAMGVALVLEGDEPGDDGDEPRNVSVEADEPAGRAVLARPSSRRPRPFDPTRIPTLKRSAKRESDPSVTLARREQAHRAHQRLIAALDVHLRSAGWTEIVELPGAIDLWGRRPKDRLRVIFECKSLNVDRPASELSRCRTGLAQLLEYRFEYGNPSDALCLVTDGHVSQRRLRFLESVGIACICFRDEQLEFLSDQAMTLFHE
jgi:hypothetical protein